jgi:acyl-CoA reductase-like NAD-dependent aldehyde dehydrogenase
VARLKLDWHGAARLASEAGIPDRVLNVVLGDGPNTGRLLASHDGIDMVAFTGSTAPAVKSRDWRICVC